MAMEHTPLRSEDQEAQEARHLSSSSVGHRRRVSISAVDRFPLQANIRHPSSEALAAHRPHKVKAKAKDILNSVAHRHPRDTRNKALLHKDIPNNVALRLRAIHSSAALPHLKEDTLSSSNSSSSIHPHKDKEFLVEAAVCLLRRVAVAVADGSKSS